ncbi:MAG TPA: gamma carbonic anhydrase family protein [bacterium]|nr:gamma carbonic anhydrase family protein [bacterium]
MPVYAFEDRVPSIAESAWIFPDAVIIGKVTIGENVYVGSGAVLRGDYGEIIVGAGTAIEEGVLVHARPAGKTVFGKRVTVGHGAMVHNATVNDNAVIGMRATVTDNSEVGEWSIVAEHALVKSRQIIPPRSIAAGVPAKVIGEVGERHVAMWEMAKDLYVDLAGRYPSGLKEIK